MFHVKHFNSSYVFHNFVVSRFWIYYNIDISIYQRAIIETEVVIATMKTKNKLITAILLSTGAAAGTALINKYIKMTATAKNLLEEPRSLCYKWRLGNIHYTKTGSGKPLLFIHDLDYVSNGTEWETLIPYLKVYNLYHRPAGIWLFRKTESYLHKFSLRPVN